MRRHVTSAGLSALRQATYRSTTCPRKLDLILRKKESRPISRVLSWAIIPLGRASPRASSGLPGSTRRPALQCCHRDFPIWPCSRWGLPCRRCCHRRGALLPHRFTLASAVSGASAVCFLLHFPWARAPQALPGTLPAEPGLSSATRGNPRNSDCLADSPAATIRPLAGALHRNRASRCYAQHRSRQALRLLVRRCARHATQLRGDRRGARRRQALQQQRQRARQQLRIAASPARRRAGDHQRDLAARQVRICHGALRPAPRACRDRRISCILVSSRAITAAALGAEGDPPVAAAWLPMRCGASNSTSVRGSCARRASAALALPGARRQKALEHEPIGRQARDRQRRGHRRRAGNRCAPRCQPRPPRAPARSPDRTAAACRRR